MLRPFVLHSLDVHICHSSATASPLSYTYLHRPTAKSSVLMPIITSCWFLVFVWVVWWLPLMLAGPEDQLGEGCSGSAKMCGNLTISRPFWLAELGMRRSCGPLDFEVGCFNYSTPVLKSAGLTGFAILNISYENRSLRVVDVYKEEDLSHSKGSCRFPRWNTSGKLATPFKVSPANLNLIFYKCTKTPAHRGRALVEIRCGNATHAFVRAGVPYDATGTYGGYALTGCNATDVPVMGSTSKVNARHYRQLINGGFLLTWEDHPTPLPEPVPLPAPAPAPARKFTRRTIFSSSL
ncbi:unnamed protein product [Triticum turgidum subsp. durum]|uniref:Wall-associated receptor kinase galacturonan-binding domain-containing protein n=1 Tax=Triticum turgidum subsp. durum TaxID=4567 RepID=A0A9R0VDN1_TRITD|nr:unnamed protein product [Triticum turgidum subsp. durum]